MEWPARAVRNHSIDFGLVIAPLLYYRESGLMICHDDAGKAARKYATVD